MNNIFEIFSLLLLSAVKYLFAILMLLAASSRAWYLDMLIVMVGGLAGVFVFTYLGAVISKYLSKFHFFRIKFSKLRKFVKIKNSYGMLGLAIITPVIISIPVGCIISSSFEHDKKKIIRYQGLSIIIWSIVLFGLKGIFGIQVKPIL